MDRRENRWTSDGRFVATAAISVQGCIIRKEEFVTAGDGGDLKLSIVRCAENERIRLLTQLSCPKGIHRSAIHSISSNKWCLLTNF